MLVRFTTKQRRKAGWIAALVYVLCILAPTLSYALPGHHAVVDCMTIEGVAAGAMHMHSTGEPAHDHASAPAMNDGDDASAMLASSSDEQAPTKKSPHLSGQCCALMCLTVLPAPIVEVAAPSVPTLIRVATSYSAPADNAPVVHYRPPHRFLIRPFRRGASPLAGDPGPWSAVISGREHVCAVWGEVRRRSFGGRETIS